MNKLCFGDLRPREKFRIKGGGSKIVKIETVYETSIVDGETNNTKYNAVHIGGDDCGRLVCIDEHTEVMPIDWKSILSKRRALEKLRDRFAHSAGLK